MTRNEAYTLLTKYLKNPNLIKHCLACEAAMKAIYHHLHPDDNQDEAETWRIVGLLHDVDYELAQREDLSKHGLLIFEKEPNAIPQDIAQAIKAHNFEGTGVMPQNDMEWAIAIVDGLTGLIVSSALIHPVKKLAPLTPDFILNRYNEKSFSRNVRRDIIQLCETKLNIPLLTFIAITLGAMQEIHSEIEL